MEEKQNTPTGKCPRCNNGDLDKTGGTQGKYLQCRCLECGYIIFMKHNMQIKIKLLHPDAKIPSKTHKTDACYDVVAVSKFDHCDGRIEYGLGFSLELPEDTQLDLRPRSSIHKTGLILSNCIGTGDEEYIGEYKAIFYHIIPSLPSYQIGDKILQIQLRNRENVDFVTVKEHGETERGMGGFGSTGK